MREKGMQVRRARLLFAIGGVLIAALYLWRMHYGNAEVDEAFHLTVPLRLIKGDRLLVDEWHVSQLFGFLLIPFAQLQKLLMGGTEQMVLNFRLFWVIEHVAVMTAVYLLLEKHACVSAVIAAWMVGLFTPFGFMTLNYNTMGVDAVTLLILLFWQEYDTRTADVCKGFLLAVLALCNPYCVSLYAVFMLLALIGGIRRTDGQFALRHVLFWHAGILLLLVPFLLHVFAGLDDPGRLLENLTYILRDPAHGAKDFYISNVSWANMMLHDNAAFFKGYAVLLLAGLLIRRIRPAAMGLIALLCAYDVLRDARYFMYRWDGNSMPLFFFFAGAAAFLFDDQRRLRTALYAFVLPLCYGICVNMASNQGLRSVLVSFMPGCCVGVMLIGDYCRHCRASWRVGRVNVPWLALVLAGALSLQLCAQTYMRIQQVFFEWEPPAVLRASIDHGPLKGIRTTEAKKEEYERLCAEIERLGDLSGKKIAFFRNVPQGYLIADARMGAPSAWMEYDSPEDERLLAYYRMNPDNRPDVLVVYRPTFDAWSREQYERYAAQQGYLIIRDQDEYLVMESVR